MTETKAIVSSIPQPYKIEFTGNWYFDLGILGFINILDKVWGVETIFDEDFKLKEYVNTVKLKWLFAYLKIKLSEFIDKKLKVKTSEIKEITKEEFEEVKKKQNFKDQVKIVLELYKKQWDRFINDEIDIELKNLKNFSKKEEPPKINSKLDPKDQFEKLKNKKLKKINELELDQKDKEKIKKAFEEEFDVRKFEEEFNRIENKEDKEKAGKFVVEYYVKAWNNFVNKSIKTKIKNIKNLFNTKLENIEKRLPLNDVFLTNYGPFNNSWSFEDQRKGFVDICESKINKDLIDKTINKFMESYNEFNNIYFSKLNPKTLPNLDDFLVIYLISFPYAFYYVLGKQYCFYSPEISLCYKVNKKIKNEIEKAKEKGSNINLIPITWSSVLDALQENKALWALDNMFVFEYGGIINDQKKKRHQEIKSFEYMSLNETKASILADDKIREALIKYGLIWDFINEKSMLDRSFKRIADLRSSDNTKKYYNREELLWTLTLEKVLKEKDRDKAYSPFKKREEHKTSILNLPNKIDHLKSKYANRNIVFNSVVYKNNSNGQKIFWLLFNPIKENNKIEFVNQINRVLLASDEKDYKKKKIIEFMFDEITPAHEYWQYPALSLILPSRWFE